MNEELHELAKKLDLPPEALEALVVGVASAPTLAWLFENVREFCEEIQPRSLVDLRASKPTHR